MISVLFERFYSDGEPVVNAFSLVIWVALILSLVYGVATPLL
jgi:hypothetical protein